ncbi:MAG: hypothetical protein A3K04_01045 [Gallionellales bacterium RBG_16_56_9]|nr:MAG: hypothetical protein A3K04_01045 [Gallionellales bacterium RBG_16_56_9]
MSQVILQANPRKTASARFTASLLYQPQKKATPRLRIHEHHCANSKIGGGTPRQSLNFAYPAPKFVSGATLLYAMLRDAFAFAQMCWLP